MLLMAAGQGYSFNRQPAYFVLDEDQFKGVQVYDVIQDLDKNYWFSTNEGLLFYNHYSYEKITCPTSKSIAFFNFVINQEGTIFCNNLSNQVFEIKDQQCRLIYELEPEEIQADMSLLTGYDNTLFICARKIIVLDAQNHVLVKNNPGQYYIGFPFRTERNEVINFISATDSISVFSNNTFSFLRLSCDTPEKMKGALRFFRVGGQSYALNLTTNDLFHFDESTFGLRLMPPNSISELNETVRLYITSHGLWVAGTMPGVLLVGTDPATKNAHHLYMTNFVSDVYEDQEGNVLVSTFDHGVLVIPDLQMPDLIRDFESDPIVSLKPQPDNSILIGTSYGKIVRFENETFTTLYENGKNPIDVLVEDKNLDFILFQDGDICMLEKKSGKLTNLLPASLKDGVIVDNRTFYLGTNSGLVRFTRPANGSNEFEVKWIPELKFRNYSVEYDTGDKALYVATVNGLFRLDSLNRIEAVLYENEPIFSSSITYHENRLYVPLTQSGILILEHGEPVQKIQPVLNGKKPIVFKLLVYENSIYAHTDEGICQFTMTGNYIRTFNRSGGETARRVLDFAISDNQLWISNPNGLQTVDLNLQDKRPPAPSLFITAIYANDRKIIPESINEFGPETRKFEFVVYAPTLRYKTKIRYHFRLLGYDTDWNVQTYYANTILYNALAPGNYTFQVKAENQGVFSDIKQFSFSIARPFYLQFWFILLVIALFLLAVFSIYRNQLNRQRIKARQLNELNASKLTAIQSQMNPHFIFNSLNSIQDLILKGDVEHSYSYIALFSNLVRRTLSYSDKDFIDFEQEVKLLDLYLSLEKLRFKRDFNYSLNTGNISDIQIPPMLVQPFIENALVHGLLHKEGAKNLTVSFTLEEDLICIIEDNGIGRAQAKAIRERQRADHESFSVQAIRKRFEILQAHYKGALGYVYEDLQREGIAAGTRVTLRIPVKRKF